MSGVPGSWWPETASAATPQPSAPPILTVPTVPIDPSAIVDLHPGWAGLPADRPTDRGRAKELWPRLRGRGLQTGEIAAALNVERTTAWRTVSILVDAGLAKQTGKRYVAVDAADAVVVLDRLTSVGDAA